MKTFAASLALLLLTVAASGAQPPGRQLFNEGWRFRRVQKLTPKEAEADFNDFGWRVVDLPHDWGVEDPADAGPGATRQLSCSGDAWYRKHLTINAEDLEGCVRFEVDGTMSATEVWVNGSRVGQGPGGCIPFSFDITAFLREGDNTIAVAVAGSAAHSVIYPGAGLYRNVWLTKGPRTGIAAVSVCIDSLAQDLSAASLLILYRLHNTGDPVEASVETRIYQDADTAGGKARAAMETPLPFLSDSTVLDQTLQLDSLSLWSPECTNLYRAVTTVRTASGQERDTTAFGIRSAEFHDGRFFLNGVEYPLKGVMLSHDLGALGAVWNADLWTDRLVRLKEMGCNALAVDAVPPAPQLLDLCDRMGFLVMDRHCIVTERNHPCLVSGGSLEDFAVWGFAPLGAAGEVPALFSMADFPTELYGSYLCRWSPQNPMAQVSLRVSKRDPGKASVDVYTTGDSGVVYINGRSQGFRKADPETGRIFWQADYEPGITEAVIFREGRPWIRKKAVPVGAPAALVWAEGVEEKIAAMAPGQACILRIPVEVVDAAGSPVDDAEPVLEFSLAGHGRVLAADSGDPESETLFSSLKIKAFHGKAAIYVYKKGDGKVLLTVRAPGLKSLRMEL